MRGSTTPDLLGLSPDDARRRCYDLDLEPLFDDASAVSWWGWDAPGARVVDQEPSAGDPLTGPFVVLRVGSLPAQGGPARVGGPLPR
jgi:hypothetical protein